MITGTKTHSLTTSLTKTADFFINPDKVEHIEQILRNLYSRPHAAVVRELAANARDAHVMAGCPDKPIKIILRRRTNLPGIVNSGNSVLIVKDMGLGLSPEDTVSLLFGYGSSAKDHTDELIGGFGIGGKCPYAITNTFTYRIWYKGVLRIWTCFLDEMDRGRAALVQELSDTKSPNGIEVEVPLKSEADYNSVMEEIKTGFMYWPVQPEVVIQQSDDSQEIPFLLSKRTTDPKKLNTFVVAMGETKYNVTWIPRDEPGDTSYGDASIVVGGLQYTVPVLDSVSPSIYRVLRFFELEVPIGLLQIAPSREAIQMSGRTKVALGLISEKLHQKDYVQSCIKPKGGDVFGSFIGDCKVGSFASKVICSNFSPIKLPANIYHDANEVYDALGLDITSKSISTAYQVDSILGGSGRTSNTHALSLRLHTKYPSPFYYTCGMGYMPGSAAILKTIEHDYAARKATLCNALLVNGAPNDVRSDLLHYTYPRSFTGGKITDRVILGVSNQLQSDTILGYCIYGYPSADLESTTTIHMLMAARIAIAWQVPYGSPYTVMITRAPEDIAKDANVQKYSARLKFIDYANLGKEIPFYDEIHQLWLRYIGESTMTYYRRGVGSRRRRSSNSGPRSSTANKEVDSKKYVELKQVVIGDSAASSEWSVFKQKDDITYLTVPVFKFKPVWKPESVVCNIMAAEDKRSNHDVPAGAAEWRKFIRTAREHFKLLSGRNTEILGVKSTGRAYTEQSDFVNLCNPDDLLKLLNIKSEDIATLVKYVRCSSLFMFAKDLDKFDSKERLFTDLLIKIADKNGFKHPHVDELQTYMDQLYTALPRCIKRWLASIKTLVPLWDVLRYWMPSDVILAAANDKDLLPKLARAAEEYATILKEGGKLLRFILFTDIEISPMVTKINVHNIEYSCRAGELMKFQPAMPYFFNRENAQFNSIRDATSDSYCYSRNTDKEWNYIGPGLFVDAVGSQWFTRFYKCTDLNALRYYYNDDKLWSQDVFKLLK